MSDQITKSAEAAIDEMVNISHGITTISTQAATVAKAMGRSIREREMNETKFTKGEWSIAAIPPNGCIPVGTNGLMVCITAHSIREPDQKEEAMANAHLIAAAPEMYAMLEKLIENYGYTSYLSNEEKEQDEDIIEARKLLSKARGEK